MRIAAFVYDFTHEKSTQGILHLSLANPSDVLILAAPRVQLEHEVHRTSLAAIHPRRVADALGFDYQVVPHASAAEPLRKFRADCAIVFGARILPEEITRLSIPILNLHPGVLPDNRGLDAAAWAVLNDLPQGVSAHIVTTRIDGGPLLGMLLLPDLGDASSVSMVRSLLSELELRVLRELLLLVRDGEIGVGREISHEELGKYHSSLPSARRSTLEARFPSYVDRYPDLVDSWLQRRHDLFGDFPAALNPTTAS